MSEVVAHLLANLPESRKKGLHPSRQWRAARFMDFANAVGAQVVTAQESGTYLQREVDDRPRWRDGFGAPNDRIKERTAGNGQLSRRAIRATGRRTITAPRTGSDAPLSLPVRRYQLGDAKWTVIGFHMQTRRADPLGRSRSEMTRLLKRYVRKLHRQGYVVVLNGDSNSGKRWDRQFHKLGMKTAIRHGVDTILVSRDIGVKSTRVHRLPKVSDHAFLWAELVMPDSTITAARLPKP